jgi:hypothetical protein
VKVKKRLKRIERLGFQQAKKVVLLSRLPPDTYRVIRLGGNKRPMSQAEASRLVEPAASRIALVDEGG